ncbi:MAG: ABC transporter substrate-binding protein/permease [Tissierellia bacterium]|nr:ABC transporter substrate-binding protein/permease [Tissierellia bacterium]
MKKFQRFLSVFVMILILLSPISRANADEDTFKVGMEVNYAPFNFSQVDDSNGAVEVSNSPSEYANGYDVQMAKKIADKLGKKLEIQKVEWDGLAPALTSGKIDAIIAGMSPTAERKKSIDFSDNYYTSNLVIVTRKDNEFANAKSLDDLSGMSVTGQLNTFHYSVIDQINNVDKKEAMESFPSMISAVLASKVDGYVSEKPGAMAAVFANDDLTFIDFEDGKGFETDPEDTSIAVGLQKNSDLLDPVNKALSEISEKERDEIMNDMVKISQNEEGEEEAVVTNKGFFEQMKEILSQYSTMFLNGAKNTMIIAIISTLIGFLIGLIVAIIKKISVDKRKNPIGYFFSKLINFILSIYIEVFRGTPMMVQAMLIFYGSKQFFGIDMSSMSAAFLIVSINTGAYLSEVVRGGINSVDEGQMEACKSIGMSHTQSMVHVILPQAIKSILPAIGNEFVINIKDTSVLNVISVTELFFMSKSIAGSTYQIFQTYLVTAIIYFVLTFVVTRIIMLIEKKMNNKDFILESSTGDRHAARNN